MTHDHIATLTDPELVSLLCELGEVKLHIRQSAPPGTFTGANPDSFSRVIDALSPANRVINMVNAEMGLRDKSRGRIRLA